LRSCVESATRIGLAGEPAGVVTEAEATYAAKVLARRQSKAKAKAAAAAAAVAAAQPKRISLADLKAAALQRRMEAASA
jgi:sRNA-binding protein